MMVEVEWSDIKVVCSDDKVALVMVEIVRSVSDG